MKWENVRLVQRLCVPSEDVGSKVANNAFSFGLGGLKFGGLSEEALRVLQPIFTFDLMGFAEFEHGEIPTALQVLIDASDSHQIVATTIPIRSNKPVSEEAANDYGSSLRASVDKHIVDVHILAPCIDFIPKIKAFMEWQLEVDMRGMPSRKPREFDESCLKCRSFAWDAFNCVDNGTNKNFWIGGFELNNNWIYLSRLDLFQKLCELFEVDITDYDVVCDLIGMKKPRKSKKVTA